MSGGIRGRRHTSDAAGVTWMPGVLARPETAFGARHPQETCGLESGRRWHDAVVASPKRIGRETPRPAPRVNPTECDKGNNRMSVDRPVASGHGRMTPAAGHETAYGPTSNDVPNVCRVGAAWGKAFPSPPVYDNPVDDGQPYKPRVHQRGLRPATPAAPSRCQRASVNWVRVKRLLSCQVAARYQPGQAQTPLPTTNRDQGSIPSTDY